MQVTATFGVQVMLKSIETDMPNFLPPNSIQHDFSVDIDEELAENVEKYLESMDDLTLGSPAYNANPLFVKRLRTEMQKVFGKETKVSNMTDDDVVDSAITHYVEDAIEDMVPSGKKGAEYLGVDVNGVCPEGFYVANVYLRLRKWKVKDGEQR